jgi:DNA-binding transcriptional ArsR family regulator
MSDIRERPDVEQGPAATVAAVPDYELEPTVRAEGSVQLKALADETRTAILDLVLERAATTTELAEALGKPKGTVDHHLKVLERAGLLRVVRTRQVRAITERFWGRTGRTILIVHQPVVDDPEARTYFVDTALREMRALPIGDDDESGFSTLRHARVPRERIEELTARLDALAVEFASSERGGDTVYGLLMSVYPTALPTLKDPA